VNDANNDSMFSVNTLSSVVNSNLPETIYTSNTGPNSLALMLVAPSSFHYNPMEVLAAGSGDVRTDAEQGLSNMTYTCWQDVPWTNPYSQGPGPNGATCFGEIVNAPGGSASLNGTVLVGNTTNDAFHVDGNTLFCVAPIGIRSSSFTPGTTPLCPTGNPFSVGTTGQFTVDSSGNATLHNLTVNGTCTGCGGGGGGNYVNLGSSVTWSTGSGGGTFASGQFTISTAASSVTISALPGTYVGLKLYMNGAVPTGDADVNFTFNSDTSSSDYDYLRGLYHTGSPDFSFNAHDVDFTICGILGTSLVEAASGSCDIYGYSSTTISKSMTGTYTSIVSGTAPYYITFSGSWRSASAVTTMTLTPNGGGNFAAGTTFSIYGYN
jgi:hypothetical protein